MQSASDAWRQLLATSGCVEAPLEAKREAGPFHRQALKRNKKPKQRLGHHDSTGCVCVFWLSAALALVPPSDDSEPTSLPTLPRDVSWGIPTRNVFLMTEEPQQLREGKENHFLMSLAEEGSAGIVFNKRSLARASLRIKTAAWEYAWPCCRYLWSSRGIVRRLSGGGGEGVQSRKQTLTMSGALWESWFPGEMMCWCSKFKVRAVAADLSLTASSSAASLW